VLLVGLVAVAAAWNPTAAGAAGYDKTNPQSTGCANQGLVEVTGGARTYGVWTVKLRRSTGCNTVWAVVTRNDGKRCRSGGTYCAKVRVTRTLSDGTKAATGFRRTPVGTNSTFSNQLNGVVGARYVGSAATISGNKIGDTATLTANANGTWTVS
jgi:hypothetical protein